MFLESILKEIDSKVKLHKIFSGFAYDVNNVELFKKPIATTCKNPS